MLFHICVKITDSLIKKDILDQELSEWCNYWLQKKIMTIIGISIMFCFGSYFFDTGITVCFLFGLLPMRRRLAGYHTQSPYMCILLSLFVTLLALKFISLLDNFASLLFCIFNFIICYILIMYILINQNSSQLHLTDEELRTNHCVAKHIFFVESFIFSLVALFTHSIRYLSACQAGILIVVVSSMYCKLNTNNKKEDYSNVNSFQDT